MLECDPLLKLRSALNHYVNLRPNKHYPGAPTSLAGPGGIDFLVVREGAKGLYYDNDGVVRQGAPHEVAAEMSVNAAYGVERVIRYVFVKAWVRPHKKFAYMHKYNVLANAGRL